MTHGHILGKEDSVLYKEDIHAYGFQFMQITFWVSLQFANRKRLYEVEGLQKRLLIEIHKNKNFTLWLHFNSKEAYFFLNLWKS